MKTENNKPYKNTQQTLLKKILYKLLLCADTNIMSINI